MLERDIEGWAKKKARTWGYWVRKFTSPGRRSVPDDVFAKSGRVFFVEFKATGAKPTELQLEEHRGMREAGLTVYVVDSRDGFDAVLVREEEQLQNSFR